MDDQKDSINHIIGYKERDCKKCSINNDDECYICDSVKRNNVINKHDFELSSFIYNIEDCKLINRYHALKIILNDNINPVINNNIQSNGINLLLKEINPESINKCVINIDSDYYKKDKKSIFIERFVTVNFIIDDINLTVKMNIAQTNNNIINKLIDRLITPIILNGLAARTLIVNPVMIINLYNDDFYSIIENLDFTDFNHAYNTHSEESKYRLFAKLYAAFYCFNRIGKVPQGGLIYNKQHSLLKNSVMAFIESKWDGKYANNYYIDVAKRYHQKTHWICIPLVFTKVINGLDLQDIKVHKELAIAAIKGPSLELVEAYLNYHFTIKINEYSSQQKSFFDKCVTYKQLNCF